MSEISFVYRFASQFSSQVWFICLSSALSQDSFASWDLAQINHTFGGAVWIRDLDMLLIIESGKGSAVLRLRIKEVAQEKGLSMTKLSQ